MLTYNSYAPPDFSDWIGFEEAAEQLGLSQFTVRNSWQEYELPFELICGRRLIHREALARWQANREQAKKDHEFRSRMAGRV